MHQKAFYKLGIKPAMKKILFILLISHMFLPSVLTAGQVVTAKGMSFIETGREVLAREKALDEAKRTAIEKALGTVVESKTVVENFAVVKDQIFSRSSGYLKNIKILEEKQTNLGTYEVQIEAEVEIAALVEDVDRFQKILKWQKNPRISVQIEPGLKQSYLATAKKSANLLIEKLKQNGFSVFRYQGSTHLQMGLLVALNLELSSRQSKYQDIDIMLNEVGLSANIYRPGDGEILAAASAVKSLPGENKLQVLDKGARACVDTIWKDLRKKLIRLWEKELYSERELFLIIKQIPSHAKAHEIIAVFKSDVSGVLDADLITFDQNTAEYTLKYRGWPDQFLNEIQMSYFKNKYFDSGLESISGNKLIIKMQ